MSDHDVKIPPQHQDRQPGHEAENPEYRGSGKLCDKVAIITGGDSGIGRAVAIDFAKEGADVAVVYLNEEEDARETRKRVEELGRRCITLTGDVGEEAVCKRVVDKVAEAFGKIDILVNNAAEQHPQKNLQDITQDQLQRTFQTNIFSMFFMTKEALRHMTEGCSIINTTSVTAYRGSPDLLDYSATKGAIIAFTRSLSLALEEKKIRVNAVAPGPIWTPLIPSTFEEERVESFGQNVPMKRPGQPDEVSPSFVFLASNIDSSYISGHVLHPDGGVVLND